MIASGPKANLHFRGFRRAKVTQSTSGGHHFQLARLAGPKTKSACPFTDGHAASIIGGVSRPGGVVSALGGGLGAGGSGHRDAGTLPRGSAPVSAVLQGVPAAGHGGLGSGVHAANRRVAAVGGVPTGHPAGRQQGETGQTGDAPCVASQFRHPFAGSGNGYPDIARLAWPQERGDDADLHARHAETGIRSEESAGWVRRLRLHGDNETAPLTQAACGARRWFPQTDRKRTCASA